MKTKSLPRLLVAAIACLASGLVLSAAEAGGSRVALFDGKNLDAFDVLKCEAVVEDGNLLIKDGNGMVQTKRKFADFTLEYEWKALKPEMWDSGVYFRYDGIPAGKPWPKQYQANLRKGLEGNVGELKDAKSTGLVKDGEWNKFKLTVRGTHVELEINGKPAWSADGLEGPAEGFIGIQAEVPQGGQFLFRNVFITELK